MDSGVVSSFLVYKHSRKILVRNPLSPILDEDQVLITFTRSHFPPISSARILSIATLLTLTTPKWLGCLCVPLQVPGLACSYALVYQVYMQILPPTVLLCWVYNLCFSDINLCHTHSLQTFSECALFSSSPWKWLQFWDRVSLYSWPETSGLPAFISWVCYHCLPQLFDWLIDCVHVRISSLIPPHGSWDWTQIVRYNSKHLYLSILSTHSSTFSFSVHIFCVLRKFLHIQGHRSFYLHFLGGTFITLNFSFLMYSFFGI